MITMSILIGFLMLHSILFPAQERKRNGNLSIHYSDQDTVIVILTWEKENILPLYLIPVHFSTKIKSENAVTDAEITIQVTKLSM